MNFLNLIEEGTSVETPAGYSVFCYNTSETRTLFIVPITGVFLNVLCPGKAIPPLCIEMNFSPEIQEKITEQGFDGDGISNKIFSELDAIIKKELQ